MGPGSRGLGGKKGKQTTGCKERETEKGCKMCSGRKQGSGDEGGIKGMMHSSIQRRLCQNPNPTNQ
jgi:hypothetical protein